MTDYEKIRRKIITDHLDKYPDAGNHTIARILYRDYPEFFTNKDTARSLVRYLRGSSGDYNRNQLKERKYVREIQPTGKL